MHLMILIPLPKTAAACSCVEPFNSYHFKQENAFLSKHQNLRKWAQPIPGVPQQMHAISSRTKHALSGQQRGCTDLQLLATKSAKPDHSATRALLVILELSKGSTMLTARASPQILVPFRLFSAALAESALLNLTTAKRGSRCN